MQRLLGRLDDRERRIIELRFGLDRGEPRTLEEVGELLDLTRERIRQIEARGDSPSCATRPTPPRCSTFSAAESPRR